MSRRFSGFGMRRLGRSDKGDGGSAVVPADAVTVDGIVVTVDAVTVTSTP